MILLVGIVGCATIDQTSGYFKSPVNSIVKSCRIEPNGMIVAQLIPQPYMVKIPDSEVRRSDEIFDDVREFDVFIKFRFQNKECHFFWKRFSI